MRHRLLAAFLISFLAVVTSWAQPPLKLPGYRQSLINYKSLHFELYPFMTDFSMPRHAIVPMAPGSYVYNPFGGGTRFILHLENFADSDWCYLLRKSKVISPYGGRGGRHHSGTDIKSFPNDSVRAVFDGTVVMAGPFSGYGNCVQIRHLNGLTTLYSHNSRNLVKAGDQVTAGQVIALEGRTGRATTAHVHFEIRVAGRHVNSNLIFDHEHHRLHKHQVVFEKNGNAHIRK